MHRSLWLTALVGALLIVPWADSATAQEDENTYVYASYYECGPGMGAAVRSVRDDWGPIIESKIESGAIATWGLLTHDTGNPWSVGIYHVGEDFGAMDAALNEVLAEYSEANPEASAQFGQACPRHEDYVWVSDLGSESGAGVAQDRQNAVMSVYWVCVEGKEAVADMIVETLWAPVLNALVSDGTLGSWSWLEHYLGGEYRRLLSVDGADHATVLAARDRLIEETGAENPGLASAFSDVCNGHTDILWNLAAGGP